MKWVCGLLLMMVIGTALFVAKLDSQNAAKRERSGVVSSRFAPNEEQRLVFASGIVEGAHRDVPIQFEIEGRLHTIFVIEGMQVRKGEILARIESDLWAKKLKAAEAKLAYTQARREWLLNAARKETIQVARARVDSAETKVRQQQKKLTRIEKLLSEKVVTQQGRDSVFYDHQFALAVLNEAKTAVTEIEAPARTDELKMADAQSAIASAEVEQARSMLEKTILKSPRDGVVLRVLGEPGQMIGPETAEPLMTMTDLNEMRVRAYVEERDALSVQIGQEAFVTTDSKPNFRYKGIIVSCTPFMTSKYFIHNKPGERLDLKTREVVIQLENANDLIVGLPVDVFINPDATFTPSEDNTPEFLSPVSTDTQVPQNSLSEKSNPLDVD